jgi:hypothetical protein
MAIYDFFLSRNGAASTPENYVGHAGRLFYDSATGEIRKSDGVTPGGVAVSVRADLITAQSLLPEEDNVPNYDLGSPTRRWHHLYIGDGGIKFNGNAYPTEQTIPYIPGAQVDDIVPATDNDINLGATDKRFANIYLGYEGLFLADQTTDANINITVDGGTLFIDGAQNLALGDLVIENTTLKSFTPNLDISIGETDDTGFFYVKRKAQFDNISFGSTEAMVSMNASGGAEPPTIFPDTILQLTSRPNKNSRVTQRAYGSTGTVGGDNSYAVWASYAARGSVASPVALKANDILMRLSANGYGATSFGSGGGARIEVVAKENFTDSAKGTKINFWTVPTGQVASQTVASIDSTGVVTTGLKFSGDETIQTTAGIPLTQKGANSGVATLGSDGKLTAAQIPDSLTGAIVFKGVWNANTNTPTLGDELPAGVQAGWEFVVEVGGTRDIGDGSKTFQAGDFVIYDGTHWKQVPSGNAFISLTGGGGITVSSSTGAITLGSTATALSTNGAIVARDSSGNFAANIITANLTGTVTGSVSGNAGTVTNGVYTTDTATVTNTMLAGSITNAKLAGSITNDKLANSTISGIALGSNLAALTIDGYLTGTSYNGSTAVTIAVDATTAATANKVVARDASGDIFARIVSDSLGNIRSIPINNKVASYILAATDNGQMISITTGGVTVNTGVFASPFGQSISIYNNSASSQTITQGAGVTLRLAGTAATGNRTLARYGVATIVCVASETFVISGAGLV